MSFANLGSLLSQFGKSGSSYLVASYSDEDVNRLVAAIMEASQCIGLSKPSKVPRQTYRHSEGQKDMVELRKESQEAHRYLECLL
jgi:hypothetical protein